MPNVYLPIVENNMTKLRCIDVSAYQSNVPWDVLLANGVCDIAIIKGGQGQQTRDHVNQARAKGIKYIVLYFWHDPTLAVFYQVLIASNDIKEFNPIAVFLDCEQWWGNWSQYWEFLAGKRLLKDMTIVTPQVIADNALGVLNGLKSAFPALLVGDYTALWFTNGWALPMLKWIMNFVLWVASYFDYGSATYKATYDQIKSNPPDTASPAMPAGVVKYILWQYSSRMIYPGQAYPYDSNIGYGTVNDFLTQAGIGEHTVAGTYNRNVAEKNRARGLVLTSSQAKASFDGLDFIMPAVGGMDAPNLYRDTSLNQWLTQASQAKIPSVPFYVLDGAFWLNGSGTALSVVQNMTLTQNQMVHDIIDSLHSGMWDYTTLDGKSGWKPFHGLSLLMYNSKTANGGDVNTIWQQATLENVLKQLLVLRSNGQFPNVPFFIWSNPTFFKTYAPVDPMYTYLRGLRSQVYAGMSEWIYSATSGPLVTDGMQAVFDTYEPSDTFTFAYTPEWFDATGINSFVMFHDFTSGRFTVPSVTDANNVPSPLELVMGADTKDAIYKLLNFVPVIIQPPTGRTLEQVDAALAQVEAKLTAIKNLL